MAASPRRIGRYPFTPFPNGWFLVAYSEELSSGAILPLSYFGTELVLFRTPSGEPRLLDAYCAHLGAHMGYGGTLEGERIRCPFHGWCFDGAGQCVEVPHAKKIPPKARVRAYPVREYEGLIVAYYHAEGAPPLHEPSPLPNYRSEEWLPYRRFRWKMRTHPQELVENGIDAAHFFSVHGATTMPVTSPPEIDGAVLRARTRATWDYRLPDGNTGPVEHHIEFMCNGVGFMYVKNALPDVATAYAGHLTPIDEEYIDARFLVHVTKGGPTLDGVPFEEITMKYFAIQMERDKDLLERKIYRGTEMLSEVDGPIGAYRRWASQFYSRAGDTR